jgi:hypothetical protein
MFKQEVADDICARLADGESLRAICSDEGMPTKTTVMRWLQDEKRVAFRDQYMRAREMQADTLFEQILEIADDGRNDSYTDDEGNVRTDHDVIARSRLRVDARKWMAGKLRPKVYGEKVETVVSGEMTVRNKTEMNDDELSAIAAGGRTGTPDATRGPQVTH